MFLLLVLYSCSPGDTGTSVGMEDWSGMHHIIENIHPPDIPDVDFPVTDFAEVADLRADIRPALQEAIDLANARGGGRVVLPPGEWISKGPVHLKSRVELHIGEAAVLRFSENPEDYLPQVFTRWEGVEAYNLSPLIYAYQASDIAITGGGIIDGNAEHGFGTWRPHQREAQNRLREWGAEGYPVHQRVFGLEDYLRPSMIQFVGCNRVLLQDITVLDSPMWVLHMIYTSHGVVRDVTVQSYRLNNDGIVLDSSDMFLVENNRFTTGDDSVVIKAGRDQDAWRVARPSQNIVVRDNYMEGHNALAIGSEMSGGVRNIYMRDNELGDVLSALYFKSNLDRGGYIEKVRIANIEVDQANYLLRFSTDYHSHRGERHPVRYQDFRIENVFANKVRTAIFAEGVAEEPVRDIHVRNMRVAYAEKAIDTTHVRNFRLEDVVITTSLD